MTLGLGIAAPAATAEAASPARPVTRTATMQQVGTTNGAPTQAAPTQSAPVQGRPSAPVGGGQRSDAQLQQDVAKRGWKWSAVKKGWKYLKKKLSKKQLSKLKNAAKRGKAAFKREWKKAPWTVRLTVKAMFFFADPIDVLMWIFNHWA
ncbi:hypothetical protein ACFOY4_34420 [Actinomadura syzygii]|uniref:Uncharacterized protein n=1 Tax=Actinomadura syzygii TaxID=1427538 RepID=A0A5D0UMK2_9ACTN|nr:hypothetical protein [Actinomadura syzygii]TYC18845.1 hypothetical protein FXF65_03675 [Actinomadura syzygii]